MSLNEVGYFLSQAIKLLEVISWTISSTFIE